MNLSQLSTLTEDQAREKLEGIRWPNGPVCAHCGCVDNITKFHGKKHRPGVYKCNDCGEQFTVTVNTVMEGSHLPIRIWLMAFSIICSAKKGISALQLQRQLGIGSYRSAWHLCHRIRHAMEQEPLKGLLSGKVEVDETYVGGKPRRFANKTRAEGKKIVGRGTPKTAVIALVSRDGRARSWPIDRVNARTLKTAIRQNVHNMSTIMTDEFPSYVGIGRGFRGGHQTVQHNAGEYARDGVHTNTVESYFSLLKRGVMGSFHHISKKHMHRYCDEFSHRWNYHKDTDAACTVAAIRGSEGRRLMYKEPVRR